MSYTLQPDFKVWEVYREGEVIVLQFGYEGLVSIDIKRRCFAGGASPWPREYFGRPLKTYTGRGWKQALFNDAMDYLRAIYKD